MSSTQSGSALVVGASRTLGLAVTAELLHRGWSVTGTVRGQRRGQLHDLAGRSRGRLGVEQPDMNDQDQVSALRRRLEGTSVDLLLVNAAITNGGHPVYRASKSALNQLVRRRAARHRDDPRTLLLVTPGWDSSP